MTALTPATPPEAAGMMKIKSVRAAALKPGAFHDGPAKLRSWNQGTELLNPLSRYLEFAGQADRFANPWGQMICIVEAEDGQFGVGMTDCAGPVTSIINEYLSPLILGENLFATERLWNLMGRACSSAFGWNGLASFAISAVDLALWDLKGKVLARPVYELLGGPAREALSCYATSMDIDWCLDLGFRAIKLCALHGAAESTRSLKANAAIVEEARKKLGDGFDLMLDLWPIQDASYSVELGTHLAPYDLRWIEDYVQPDDDAGYRTVRNRLPHQTLAAGERWFSPQRFTVAAQERWVDVIQPDIQWVGGATAIQRIAHVADAAGIDLALHLACNDAYGQHLSYALPACRWNEFFVKTAPGEDLRKGARPTPGMALPVDGQLIPNDTPGFGIELSRNQIDALF